MVAAGGAVWAGGLAGVTAALAHPALSPAPQSPAAGRLRRHGVASGTGQTAPKHPSKVMPVGSRGVCLALMSGGAGPSDTVLGSVCLPARTCLRLALPKPSLLPPKCICDWGIAFPTSTAQWRPDSW